MAGTRPEWERYERWCTAIAEVVYTEVEAGRPAYLDLEDEVLASIRSAAEPSADEPVVALVEACAATLDFDDGSRPLLKSHLDRLRRWHDGSMLDPPPSLALLALLSLTAERMRHSEDMSPHNFYGRLGELAGFDERQTERFITAYRKRDAHHNPVSRQLWESLNDWLEMHEGSRGNPTAHPLGHEHIGWPLSQALVRQADRDKFVDLFAAFGLPARSVLAASEMTNLIDEWMARRPCPATNHLERLWTSWPLTRPRITELACLALESWDGQLREGQRRGSHREIDAVKIRALVRTFPTRRLDVSLVIPTHARDSVERLEVLDLDGQSMTTLEMVPVASGWVGVSPTNEIDTASLLGGEVRLRRVGFEQPLKRRSRRLIPMRWDELLSSYVECERVQLGEKSMLLSRSEIAQRVNDLLERCARPGFRWLTELDGVPDGWTAFDGVQILSSIPHELLKNSLVDFYALQPLALSQVVLQGGLKLPGHLPKWHHALPPELRASSDEDGDLTASLICTRPLVNPPPPDESYRGSGAALVWDLAESDLPDGDYEIEILASGSLIDTQVLRLRSADNPALLSGDQGDPIVNDPVASGFALFPIRSSSARAFGVAPDDASELGGLTVPSVPGWWVARAQKSTEPAPKHVVRFPQDTEHSCIRTGAHYMELPMVTSGISSIEGVCKYCGLVKAYPAKFRPGKRGTTVAALLAPSVRVADLPPVRTEQSIDWGIAFDAVCHVGAGSMGALERITAQMDNSGLFTDGFARRLEVLGHIEIERSLATLKASGWQTSDPTLIEIETGELVLTGFRNERIMVSIEDRVWDEKGRLNIDHEHDSPPIVMIDGLDREAAKRLAVTISDAAQRPSRLIWSAARALAASLPPLSRSRMDLPLTSTISARTYEHWDAVTARFEPASDAGMGGAFRLSAAERTYIYRRGDDLGAMRATLGDARIVKYLAAADAGRSLIGFDEEREILYVPLGADLPGLYGRAAALASGRPPIENAAERILEYRGVPKELAAHLNYLVMH